MPFGYWALGEDNEMMENKLENECIEENINKSVYINRFEKEGKLKTWNYIVLNAAFTGLAGAFIISTLSDSPYVIGLGSLPFSIGAAYAFHKESTKRSKENFK